MPSLFSGNGYYRKPCSFIVSGQNHGRKRARVDSDVSQQLTFQSHLVYVEVLPKKPDFCLTVIVYGTARSLYNMSAID